MKATQAETRPINAPLIFITLTVALALGVAIGMHSLTQTFMQKEQLIITGATYDRANKLLVIEAKNMGTYPVTLSGMTIQPRVGSVPEESLTSAGGGGITSWGAVVAGGTKFRIAIRDLMLTAGSIYEVQILTARGNRFTYVFSA